MNPVYPVAPRSPAFLPLSGLPLTAPKLRSGEIHYWYMSFLGEEERSEVFREWLLDDELTRADRLRVPVKRLWFMMARGSLRALLAWYCGCQPRDLRFSYGPHGKPSLAEPHRSAIDGAPLEFNLAHSHGYFFLGVRLGAPLGVDLEARRDAPEAQRLFKRFFTSQEADALAAVDEVARSDAFFRGWTRKEAYIKATGEGMSFPFSRFSVNFADAAEPARLVSIDGDAARGAAWTLQHIEPGPECIAAATWQGPPVEVTMGWRIAPAFLLQHPAFRNSAAPR